MQVAGSDGGPIVIKIGKGFVAGPRGILIATFNSSMGSPNSSIVKPALLVATGRGVALAAMFAVPMFFARVLAPGEFGTYKQFFLIHATFYGIALGLAEGLFYFLPLDAANSGRYVANSLAMLTACGIAGLLLLSGGASWIGRIFNNPELGRLAPLLGIYLLMTLASSPLEIVMLSRSRNLSASVSYALSDVLRAGLLLLPVMVWRTVGVLVAGSIAFAAARLIAFIIYICRDYGGRLVLDFGCLRRQLSYSAPLQIAVALQVLQVNWHQYIVSMSFDAATFARYAVGCMQIPVFEIIAGSVCSVMMVQMGYRLKDRDNEAVVQIWSDTTTKLALMFFPAVFLLFVAAPDLIMVLFTAAYASSTPIIRIWLLSFSLSAFQPHAVLRVYNDTRFLAIQNLCKLAFVAVLIIPAIQRFGLVGAVTVAVGAILLGKCMLLIRLKTHVHSTCSSILPWRSIGHVVMMSMIATVPAAVSRYSLHSAAVARLSTTVAIYSVTYLLVGLFFLRRSQECSDLLRLTKWMPKRLTGIMAGKA